MAKKHIAFVTPVYLPANLYGSDMYVREIAEALARHGHRVSIITSSAMSPLYWYDPFFSPHVSVGEEVIQNVRVIRLPCNQLFSLAHYAWFRITGSRQSEIAYQGPCLSGVSDLLNRESFDVVHTSPFPLYLNKQIAAAIDHSDIKPRLVQTPFFHGRVDAYTNPEIASLFSASDAIHVITESEKRDIVRMHAADGKKVHTIPLFLNTKHMHTLESIKKEVTIFKKKHHLEKKKILLFAGLKGAMKGALDVLSAVNILHAQDPNIVLVAMGHNTTEWNALRAQVSPTAVVDLGYKTGIEKEAIFAASDIYAMPSKSDSFGLVYLEAWHKKKPVIAAQVPAARDLIGRHAGGVLVPFGNQKKLQHAMTTLLTDSTLAKKSGINGYRALMKYYTLSAVYSSYEDFFLS